MLVILFFLTKADLFVFLLMQADLNNHIILVGFNERRHIGKY